MPRIIQPSFARGEIGPDLYGRVDVAAYPVSLRTAINAIIHSYGGVSNRPGLMYVGPCATHTGTPPALIEFKFSSQDTYILEFGNLYMRVVRNDAHVLNAAVSITGATQADPCVVTATGHGLSDGDDVYVASVGGMTQLNARWFTVANSTANTFELTSQQTGADIDATGYDAYTSGGTVSSVYEITTPYAIADVLDLYPVQSANVMTLTHTSYPPHELSRLDHDDWTLEEVTFAPAQTPPTDVDLNIHTTGSTRLRYQVTAINDETGEESLPGLSANVATITGATAADPVVVTAASHGFLDYDEVEINDIVGTTELNGRRFRIAGVTTNTFELEGVDGSGYSAYTSGGEAAQTFISKNNGTLTPAATVSWTPVEGVSKYSIYRAIENQEFGWIADVPGASYRDRNIEEDYSLSAPKFRNPFFGAGNYPAAVTYYEQRRVFGGTTNAPDTKNYSRTASQDNMTRSSPGQADDAITTTLNSPQVNDIRGFAAMNDLLVLTSGAEWRVNSGQDSLFSAETLKQKPQSNWGSAKIPPIVVGDKVLFVTENASFVRSIGYEIAVDGYRGNDMTVFAPHLFSKGKTVVDWAFARWPDQHIHAVRSDGWAVVLAFNPEQEVVAWTRWNTSGKFLRVASTRPTSTSAEQAAYYVVQRKIGGSTAYYIERTKSREFEDVRDCFFVDSGLSLDTPVNITGVTSADPVVVTAASHGFSDGDEVDVCDVLWDPDVDASFNYTQPDALNKRRYYAASTTTNTLELVRQSGRVDLTGATQANPCEVTSEDHGFSDGDKIGIFNVAGMTQLNGSTYTVANATADTFELSGVDSSAFTAYTSGGTAFPCEDGTGFNDYDEGGTLRAPATIIRGLWHLEGREVTVLADGNVISGKTVANGQITLDYGASRVHAGLRYISDVGTLDPELTYQGQTIQGKPSRVPYVTVRMKESRGLLVGPDADNLTEMKQREFENYGEPTNLLTGDKEIHLTPDWDGGGKVYLRQIHPLPMTILALIPFLEVGDDDEQ